MSNLKGAVLAMALWVGAVFPFLLMLGIDSFQQRIYLSTTEKVADLVRQEGGVSNQVIQVANKLKNKGYTVTFSKSGLVQFGEEVVIRYRYEYPNVRGKQTLDTQNKVVITKRTNGKSGGSNQEDNTNIPKSYVITTAESLQANNEYTYTIPGLKSLVDVTSNTGTVEVVRVNGENVTVKLSKGAVARTIQTGGKYVPADTKFVTEQKRASYNLNGYKGTLQLYERIPAASKKIIDYEIPLYGKIDYSCKNGAWEKDGLYIAYNNNFWYTDDEGYVGGIGKDFGGTTQKKETLDLMDVLNNPNMFDDFGNLYYSNMEVNLKLPCSKELYSEEAEYLNDQEHLIARGSDRVAGSMVYSGTVTRPEVTLYQGNVTRPETDTRTYSHYYQYELRFEYH